MVYGELGCYYSPAYAKNKKISMNEKLKNRE